MSRDTEFIDVDIVTCEKILFNFRLKTVEIVGRCSMVEILLFLETVFILVSFSKVCGGYLTNL